MKKSKTKLIETVLQKSGLRARIDANCIACIYDDLSPGTWRQQVENCSVSDCAIWAVRAKSRRSGANSDVKTLDRVLVSRRAEGSKTQQFDYISTHKVRDGEPRS